MTIDRYSKTLLTLIALALIAIAMRGFTPAPAVAQFGVSCGARDNPCYIDTVFGFEIELDLPFGLDVNVRK